MHACVYVRMRVHVRVFVCVKQAGASAGEPSHKNVKRGIGAKGIRTSPRTAT